MDEEKLNLTLRKFLKEFGITSQRVIEQAVAASGKTSGRIEITATIKASGIGLDHEVKGALDLG
jgi:hypothetical protein